MTDVNLETVKTRDNSEYTRDEFTQLFIDLVKVCKPEHPYTDVSGVDTPSDTVTAFEYADLTHEHIKTGWKRKDSNSWASCGPRHFPPYIAYYGIDLGYFQSVSMERVLAVTTHELTHIPIGRHSDILPVVHDGASHTEGMPANRRWQRVPRPHHTRSTASPPQSHKSGC